MIKIRWWLLREIKDKKIDLVKTWDSIVNTSQRYQPVEDTDIDDDQTILMNENASQVSFDNFFEKENASEKAKKNLHDSNDSKINQSEKNNNANEDVDGDIPTETEAEADSPEQ